MQEHIIKIEQHIKKSRIKEIILSFLFYIEMIGGMGLLIYSIYGCFFKENLKFYLLLLFGGIILDFILILFTSSKINNINLEIGKWEIMEFGGIYANRLKIFKKDDNTYILIFKFHKKNTLFLEYHIDEKLFRTLKDLNENDNFIFLDKTLLLNRFEYSLNYLSYERIFPKEEIVEEKEDVVKEDKSNKKKVKKDKRNKKEAV